MSVNDEVVIDDDEQPQKAPIKVPAAVRTAYGKWQRWPLWARIGSGIVAAYFGLGLLTGVRNTITGGDGGGAAAAPVTTAPPSPVGSSPTSTIEPDVDPTRALKNLPELQPLAALLVPERDLQVLANAVVLLTADGTSVCDLWFGTKIDDGRAVWAITSLANEQEKGGHVLPSSRYPVRLFVGAPCDRVAPDVPATTTTAPPSPVTGEAGG